MAVLVSDLIGEALELIGVIPQNGAPNASELARAFSLLNLSVIDPLKNNPLFAYEAAMTSDTLAAATQTRTYGPSGDFVHPRPVFIKGAKLRISSMEQELEYTTSVARWLQEKEYLTGVRPTLLFDDCGYPNRTFYFNPKPSGTPTLEVFPLHTIEQFAATNSNVAIPPGYYAFLCHSLAIVCAGPFGMTVPPSVAAVQQNISNGIQAANGSLMGIQVPQPAAQGA